MVTEPGLLSLGLRSVQYILKILQYNIILQQCILILQYNIILQHYILIYHITTLFKLAITGAAMARSSQQGVHNGWKMKIKKTSCKTYTAIQKLTFSFNKFHCFSCLFMYLCSRLTSLIYLLCRPTIIINSPQFFLKKSDEN